MVVRSLFLVVPLFSDCVFFFFFFFVFCFLDICSLCIGLGVKKRICLNAVSSCLFMFNKANMRPMHMYNYSRTSIARTSLRP